MSGSTKTKTMAGTAKPRVTALIDTYNQERFIAEAIESVLAQDFPADDMEVLVVDDGSTDGTQGIVRRYAGRVRYVRQENSGQASALNTGFAEARGEIVALLDGDDIWLPQKIRRTVETFEQHPEAGLVYHPLEFVVTETGQVTRDQAFPNVSGEVLSCMTNALRYGDFSTSAMAFRRPAVEKLLPIPACLTILADGFLGSTMAFVAPVAALPEHLTRYRVHEQNLCTFGVGDPIRQKRRAHCSAAVADEIQKWVVRAGVDTTRPEVRTYLRRQELVARMVRFTSEPPNRAEFFRYLRDYQETCRPLWTLRYRVFQRCLAATGFVLGYERFTEMREWYRGSRASVRLREGAFPVRAQEAALP